MCRESVCLSVCLMELSTTCTQAILLEDIAIIDVTGGSDFFCIFSGLLTMPHVKTLEPESDRDPDGILTSSSSAVSLTKEKDEAVVMPTFRTVRKASNETLKYATYSMSPATDLSAENASDRRARALSKTQKSVDVDDKFNETGFLSI